MALLCGLVLFSISLASWHGTWALVPVVAMPTALLPILFLWKAPAALFTRMQTNSTQTEKLAETSQSLSQQSAGLMVLVKDFNSGAESERVPEPRRLRA